MYAIKTKGALLVALVLFLSNVAFADAVAEDSTVTTEFTMSLKDGTVVATHLRGAQLESELQRLL